MVRQAVQGKKKQSEKKIYILDTNVLIHDPQALFAFKGMHIGLPIMVIQELDSFKTESSQRGRNAREAIRTLDKFRQQGSLAEGVTLPDDTIVQILVVENGHDIPFSLQREDPDNKILLDALTMQRQGYYVIFISKDLNMRIKADALGLQTEDYKRETIAEDDFYKGWITIPVSAIELKQPEPKVLIDAITTYKLVPNEFVLLQGNRNEDNYRLFRYLGGKNFKAVEQPRLPWPIYARNPQQLMAFDLLMDDSIQLVTLFGQAGTGKTFLSLAAALQKVLITKSFQKLLVARPIVPLGRDIGYLPGDLQEKLYSWMQPVRDNMEFIIHKAHATQMPGATNEYQEEEKHARHNHHNHNHSHGRKGHDKKKSRGFGGGIPSLDDMIKAQKISLEAITYMRGRSIPYQYILIDEVQNLTPHEVKTLITRVGEGSKIVLAGDPYQIDSPYLDFASNGLVVASDRFRGQSLFGTVFLTKSERSPLSQLAADLL